MRQLLTLEKFLSRIVMGIGRAGAWIAIPLMVIIIFDVITRRFLVLGSTKLQEGEWHLHAMLFLLCMGFVYLKDGHVRIDLMRERMTSRTRSWVEFLGCLLFAIPYCLIVAWFSIDFVERSWHLNEASDSATGLPYRWAIKAFMPIGMFALLLAGIVVLLRRFIDLFGPPDFRCTVEEQEAQPAEDIEAVAPDRGR
ncbi:MAG: TRAP transporter small permease subunit [Defluviicoccus sp.]|nr:TRAP transporter small permease subunit [Defluviicoccus sp.]MDE0274683.1 TRAP transporter small permease subunit [Defluviicoccus sp.]